MLKVMTPEEVNEYTNRLRALNDLIQAALSESSNLDKSALILLKQEIKRIVQREIDKITGEITKNINSVLKDAIVKNSKCSALLNVPGSPDELRQYLIGLATALFGDQKMQTASIIASYVEPLTRLMSELNRTKTLTIQALSSGNTLNFKVPTIDDIVSSEGWE